MTDLTALAGAVTSSSQQGLLHLSAVVAWALVHESEPFGTGRQLAAAHSLWRTLSNSLGLNKVVLHDACMNEAQFKGLSILAFEEWQLALDLALARGCGPEQVMEI